MVVDDELVGKAREVLGTKGIKDTIEGALTEVVRAERRKRLIERFRTGEGFDPAALVTARGQWGAAR